MEVEREHFTSHHSEEMPQNESAVTGCSKQIGIAKDGHVAATVAGNASQHECNMEGTKHLISASVVS